jgi:hypothetical protein
MYCKRSSGIDKSGKQWAGVDDVTSASKQNEQKQYMNKN